MRNYIDQITPVETPKRGKCIKIYVYTEYKIDYAGIHKKWTNKKMSRLYQIGQKPNLDKSE